MQTTKSIGNVERRKFMSIIQQLFFYATVQPYQGMAMVQDAQLTSWWHDYPKPDFNEIYTQPTRIKHENCSHKKGVSRAPCSFQAGAPFRIFFFFKVEQFWILKKNPLSTHFLQATKQTVSKGLLHVQPAML